MVSTSSHSSCRSSVRSRSPHRRSTGESRARDSVFLASTAPSRPFREVVNVSINAWSRISRRRVDAGNQHRGSRGAGGPAVFKHFIDGPEPWCGTIGSASVLGTRRRCCDSGRRSEFRANRVELHAGSDGPGILQSSSDNCCCGCNHRAARSDIAAAGKLEPSRIEQNWRLADSAWNYRVGCHRSPSHRQRQRSRLHSHQSGLIDQCACGPASAEPRIRDPARGGRPRDSLSGSRGRGSRMSGSG